MILALGPSDVLPSSRGKEIQNIEITDFSQGVLRVMRHCDFCVYQEHVDGEMKVLKDRDNRRAA